MSTLLACHNLHFSYGNHSVLSEFSATFSAGDIWVVQGESGCGKSTWLSLLAGLIQPKTGSVTRSAQHSISMLFQDQALWPHLTVQEHLTLVLKKTHPNTANRLAAANQCLDEVGLADLTDRLPEDLSGGERQRLALARARATNPDILLLDEPFNHLDIDRATKIAQQIAQHPKRSDTLTIAVSHSDPSLFGHDAKRATFTATGLDLSC